MVQRSARCGARSLNTEGMQQHVNTKHPQVYETIMKTSSHSATTKEYRPIALAGESNEAPEVELTTVPATLQAADASKNIQ